MTSSWMCSYPGEKPANLHIWETPLPVPRGDQSEGDYTLPANMRHVNDKADQQVELAAEPASPENTQPISQMLTSTVSDGEYTAPIALNVDNEQQTADVPPQPMPEYTLPIKKEIRESSPAHKNDVPSPEDYLQPVTVRPEPVGANDLSKAVAFEGSSLKYSGYRPDSVMISSVIAEDTDDYMNAEAESSHDALLQDAK